MCVNPKVVASIEARMNSSRFPGKMMAAINGKPTIERVVERLQKSAMLNDIVLATTVANYDDVLSDWANVNKIKCYRGSESDVLNRVVCAHNMMSTDIVVEVTGDCPLLDPEILDMAISTYLINNCDVVTNLTHVTYPQGIDIQIYSLKLLEYVEKNIQDKAVREHVSLYFYENPDKYDLLTLIAPKKQCFPKVRLQLDYQEDYEFINQIYKRIIDKHGDVHFGLDDILGIVNSEPKLLEINKHCIEKSAR